MTIAESYNRYTFRADKRICTSEIPIIDTRKAKTSLLLRDGEVVIMGGLRRKETTNQRSQIPLLGDLPFVGVLFSNNQVIVKNSELIVLLSPHIYKGEPIPEEVMAKYDEIKNRPLPSITNWYEKLKREAMDDVRK